MALTKVGKEGITGISNSSDATAITIDSSENVGIGVTSMTNKLVLPNASYFAMQDSGGSENLAIRANSSNAMELLTGGGVRATIDSGGNLLIGVSSFTSGGGGIKFGGPGDREFSVGGTGAIQQIGFHNPNGEVGSIYTTGSSTVFATSSDYRLKENIDYTWDATTRLKQLKPARFNFIADDTNTLVDGFIAHEAATVVPESVIGTKDAVDEDGNIKPQGIDQAKLVPLLVKTIQELEARITALEAD